MARPAAEMYGLCLAGADPDDMAFEKTDEPLYGFLPVILLRICLRTTVLYDNICRYGLQCCFCLVDCRHFRMI